MKGGIKSNLNMNKRAVAIEVTAFFLFANFVFKLPYIHLLYTFAPIIFLHYG